MERTRPSLINLAALASDAFASLRAHFSHFVPGLRLKLSLVVVAISLIGVLASSLLLLNLLQEQIIDDAESSIARLHTVLLASLEHAMVEHNTAMSNDILQNVASDMGGQGIRILDLRGIVRNSSSLAEIGVRIERSAPECRACHVDGTAQAIATRTIRHSDETGIPELLSVSLITNEPQCTGCHDTQVKALGILMITAPLTDLNRQLQEGFGRVALAALSAFTLLVGLMVPVLRKLITAPLGELSKGIAEIGAENLDYQVRVNSHDELGQLAETFNSMRQQLKASHTVMDQRNQELSLLYEVALVTGQLLKLEQILNHALDTVVDRLALEAGIIYLWDDAKKRFEVVSSRGLSNQQLRVIDQRRRRPGGDLTLEVALTGDIFFVPDASRDYHFAGLWENLHQRSYVNVPLKSKGRAVGTIELVSHAEEPLTDRQVQVLKAVGLEIGIAIDNTSLLIETQRSAREALTLYQLGTQVSSSLELDQVLHAVATGAREVLASDIGMVGLLDAEHQVLMLKAIAGAHTAEWYGLRIPVKHLRASVLSEPLSLAERPPDLPESLTHLWDTEQITSVLAVPLLRGERPHGIVAVLTRARRAFSEADSRLLTRLAQQVVVAIENARLYQRVRQLAVLEERDRLAREMHDDLAQTLGYLNLKTNITGDLLARREIEQAQASLLEMKQIAREAYTDTREAIFNLRNTVSSGADLMPMLREYLAEYRTHYGLDAQIVVEEASPVEFPADVAVQVSRIIQEGLTNIRKHAQATRVWVRFEREGDRARVVIEDNGRGFDPIVAQADGEEHFGLQIMCERAKSAGGTVELESRIGHGTRVVVYVPIPPGA